MNLIETLKSMKDGLKIKPREKHIDVKPLSYNPETTVKTLNSKGWKKNADGWLEKETSYD